MDPAAGLRGRLVVARLVPARGRRHVRQGDGRSAPRPPLRSRPRRAGSVRVLVAVRDQQRQGWLLDQSGMPVEHQDQSEEVQQHQLRRPCRGGSLLALHMELPMEMQGTYDSDRFRVVDDDWGPRDLRPPPRLRRVGARGAASIVRTHPRAPGTSRLLLHHVRRARNCHGAPDVSPHDAAAQGVALHR